METNYQRRNAEIFGDNHRDGVSASAKSRLLLEQKSVVWVKSHSKYNVERQIELLLKFLHFSNNEEQNASQDRLAQLNPLLILLKAKFKSVHMPGSIITVDETMVPWRGRLSFRQYVPGKSHKYGVKMYKVADINGYT